MTVSEAIGGFDRIRPNAYSLRDKIRWLSELDGRLYLEVLCTHAPFPTQPLPVYTEADGEKELLVGKPYEDLYFKWLEQKTDYDNGETGSFLNSSAAFLSLYTEFRNHYHRTHTPISTRARYF